MDVQVYSTPGKEFIEITRYPIELVAEVEHDTEIGILYGQWRKLGQPPKMKKFRPHGANTGCFRVSNELPIDFVYISTDDPMQMLPLCVMDSELIQKQAMDDLLVVKERREALYQQVIHRFEQSEMCFRRILLPTINDDGKVDLIYSTTRQFGTVRSVFFEKEFA